MVYLHFLSKMKMLSSELGPLESIVSISLHLALGHLSCSFEDIRGKPKALKKDFFKKKV